MANILFLAHRIPYPPNKGDKIRSWNFLLRLAEKHNVHAGFFIDDAKDLEHLPLLKNTVSTLCYQQVSPIWQKIRSLSGLLRGKSLTESAYPFAQLKKYCNQLISSGEVDVVFLFSAATAPLIPTSSNIKVIADLVDVDSQKWLSYSNTAPWPLSWLYAREARQLSKFEAAVAVRSQATVLVSEDEAALFRSINPAIESKINAVPNGVDTAFFDPSKFPEKKERIGKTVIFTGAMDYLPNIEAVEWFTKKVWPLVKRDHPNAIFEIAGGPELARVNRLAVKDSVKVLGYVPDMAATLSNADIAVAPLRTARGIQNKVLEALSMAKPLVATSLANEGINGTANKHLCIADSEQAFAEALNDLILHEEKGVALGAAGRSFVVENFSWETSFQSLNDLIFGEC